MLKINYDRIKKLEEITNGKYRLILQEEDKLSELITNYDATERSKIKNRIYKLNRNIRLLKNEYNLYHQITILFNNYLNTKKHLKY